METLFLPLLYISYILFLYLKYKFPNYGMLLKYERRNFNNVLDLSNLINHKKKYTNYEIQKFKEKCRIKLRIHLCICLIILFLTLIKIWL